MADELVGIETELIEVAAIHGYLESIQHEIECGDMENEPVIRIEMNKETLPVFTEFRKVAGERDIQVWEYYGVPIKINEMLETGAVECISYNLTQVGTA